MRKNKKQSFIELYDIVFCRLLFNNTNGEYQAKDINIFSYIPQNVFEFDKIITQKIKKEKLTVWNDYLNITPELMNFSCLARIDKKFFLLLEGNLMITEDLGNDYHELNELYSLLDLKLKDFIHVVVPISTFNRNFEKAPILFATIIMKKNKIQKNRNQIQKYWFGFYRDVIDFFKEEYET